MHTISYQEYLAPCCAIAREAGALIMGFFSGDLAARRKADDSPVTDADVAANTLIVNALKAMTPQIPVIAEEDEWHEQAARSFWLVDPLDGTRSFVRGEPEFTVNIALVVDNHAVLGVIYGPPQATLYYGGQGLGAFREHDNRNAVAIRARKPAKDGLVVVRSRSHPSPKAEAFLASLAIKEMVPGSSSMKFCMVAEGNADLYPRFGRTMEWDTAAGQAILEAAGGRMLTAEGLPFTYGKPGFENPHFIASGVPAAL